MKPPYLNITVAILTARDLSPRPSAECLLSVLDKFPRFKPDIFGYYEPVIEPFTNNESILGSWKDPFLWKNKKSGVDGSAWHGRGNQHSAIYLSGSLDRIQAEDGLSFLVECASAFDADFGYVHLTTEKELHGGVVPYKMAYSMDLGVSTRDLNHGIPNLAWATLFGNVYVPMLELGAISPQAEAVRVNRGTQALLKFSRPLESIASDFESFNSERERIKNDIGGGVFWGMDLKRAQHVPKFKFV